MAEYKKLDIGVVLRYYKRAEVQSALLDCALDKEVAVSYGGTGYGKRPDILSYPRDVLEAVKQGATSFHCSEERWKNPLQVTTGMRPAELNDLRSGWDLLLDIDCPELEYSKVAADLLVQALVYKGITCVSVKFSGNHGFHIGVPFEAFPDFVNVGGVLTQIKDLFPEGPRRIAAYLQWMINNSENDFILAKRLLALDSIDVIAQKTKKQRSDILKNGSLDPFSFLSIDTVLIASRHLYRMPYSLNEKSGLVSVLIDRNDILSFNKDSARPEVVVPKTGFLRRDNVIKNEASRLFRDAFDFKPKIEESSVKIEEKRHFDEILTAIPEQYFPPCIMKISQGLKDGKKRALLILINFLSSCGWKYEDMEKYVNEWNKKNPEPLREVYINGQLRYVKLQKKAKLPPSCSNKAYMVDIGVCSPDGYCQKIKNPAHYSVSRQRLAAWMAENETKKRKKKDQPETDKSAVKQ